MGKKKKDANYDVFLKELRNKTKCGIAPEQKYIGQGKWILKNTKGLKQSELDACIAYSKPLGEDLYLSYDKNTMRNGHIMCFGGSGTGKSRYLVKPTILTAAGSYIVIDPSGELLTATGHFLENYGNYVTGNPDDNYLVRVLNVNDVSFSHRYNPFRYIKDDNDIAVFIDSVVANIGGKSDGGSAFWDSAKINLLTALVAYLYEAYPIEQRTFSNLTRLLRMFKEDDAGEGFAAINLLFNDWEKKTKGKSIAVKQWNTFLQSRGDTRSNILITTGVDVSRVFDIEGIENLTIRDEMHLEQVGNKRTAIFLVLPTAVTTYNFLSALLVTQLFQMLYKQCESNGAFKRLPLPVDFLLDELANVGTIPNLDKYISTARKYGITITPIYQAKSQMMQTKESEKIANTLIANCDILVFLGGTDLDTLNMLVEKLGSSTIKENNQNYGGKSDGQVNVSTRGRKLMTADEISNMNGEEQLVFVRSEKPFKVAKYDLPSHPNYKYSGDADKKYEIAINEYCNTKVPIPGTEAGVYVLFKMDDKGYFITNDKGRKIPLATLPEYVDEYAIIEPTLKKNAQGQIVNINGYVLAPKGGNPFGKAIDKEGKPVENQPLEPVVLGNFPDPDSPDFGGTYVNKNNIVFEDIYGMETEFSKKKKEKGTTENVTETTENIAEEILKAVDTAIGEELKTNTKNCLQEIIEKATTEFDIQFSDIKGEKFIPLAKTDIEFEIIEEKIPDELF